MVIMSNGSDRKAWVRSDSSCATECMVGRHSGVVRRHANRGGARNFGLGGPNCDANILVKTNLYTHTYI